MILLDRRVLLPEAVALLILKGNAVHIGGTVRVCRTVDGVEVLISGDDTVLILLDFPLIVQLVEAYSMA